jgi:hypothetical protein
MAEGDSAGLVMYGTDYAWLGVKRSAGARQLVLVRCQDAMSGCAEQTLFSAPLAARSVYLAMDVAEGARTTFGFSLDGKRYTQAGPVFQAVPGRWVGAQMGLFSAAANPDARGHVDVDEFRVTVKRD